MNPALLVAFAGVDVVLILTPGADWAYAIATGVRGRPIAPAVAGLVGGYLVHAALVIAGVGALLARDAAALRVVTVAGALYLVWLGTAVVRSAPAPYAVDARCSAWAAARRGATVSGLNPKGLLLFLAVLPQFVDRSAPWPASGQLAVLAAVHLAGCAAVYTSVALGARRVLAARPAVSRHVVRISGTAMVVVGALLLAEAARR
jgi:threonine/homoserine/homoserine lactone efflux protein